MASIALSSLQSDLNLKFSEDHLTATTLTDNGLHTLWGGAKASVGAVTGKYWFKATLDSNLPSNVDSEVSAALKKAAQSQARHGFKIGVSQEHCSPSGLGSAAKSWCYCSTGRLQGSDQEETSDVPTLEEGDEIGCYVDFGNNEVTVAFSKNGEWLGEMFRIPGKAKEKLFPHIALKNSTVTVSFKGSRVNHFEPWQYVQTEAVANAGLELPTSECEVLFVTGLPAAGKTEWSDERALTLPMKQYRVINIELVLDTMQVVRKDVRRRIRTQSQLVIIKDWVDQLVSQLLPLAANRPGNYIIDHHSLISAEGRKQMMHPFEEAGFQLKAVALVQDVGEQTKRQRLALAASSITAKAYSAAQALMSLPRQSEGFKEVLYPKELMNSSERILYAAQQESKQQAKRQPPAAKEALSSKVAEEPPQKVAKATQDDTPEKSRTKHRGRRGGRNRIQRAQAMAPKPRLGPAINPADLGKPRPKARPLAGLKPGYAGLAAQTSASTVQAQMPANSGGILSSIIANNSMRGPPGFEGYDAAPTRAFNSQQAGILVDGPPGFEALPSQFPGQQPMGPRGSDPVIQGQGNLQQSLTPLANIAQGVQRQSEQNNQQYFEQRAPTGNASGFMQQDARPELRGQAFGSGPPGFEPGLSLPTHGAGPANGLHEFRPGQQSSNLSMGNGGREHLDTRGNAEHSLNLAGFGGNARSERAQRYHEGPSLGHQAGQEHGRQQARSNLGGHPGQPNIPVQGSGWVELKEELRPSQVEKNAALPFRPIHSGRDAAARPSHMDAAMSASAGDMPHYQQPQHAGQEALHPDFIPDSGQAPSQRDQERRAAWQQDKESRLGYMSPALPGHVSSHSTNHHHALQSSTFQRGQAHGPLRAPASLHGAANDAFQATGILQGRAANNVPSFQTANPADFEARQTGAGRPGDHEAAGREPEPSKWPRQGGRPDKRASQQQKAKTLQSQTEKLSGIPAAENPGEWRAHTNDAHVPHHQSSLRDHAKQQTRSQQRQTMPGRDDTIEVAAAVYGQSLVPRQDPDFRHSHTHGAPAVHNGYRHPSDTNWWENPHHLQQQEVYRRNDLQHDQTGQFAPAFQPPLPPEGPESQFHGQHFGGTEEYIPLTQDPYQSVYGAAGHAGNREASWSHQAGFPGQAGENGIQDYGRPHMLPGHHYPQRQQWHGPSQAPPWS